MRVVAGTAKGKKLEAKEGLTTRPTLDKVKEAVFGAIQFSIADTRWLDLFAGSGGMGIEALSRGASECIFADADTECIAVIKKNLASCRLSERAMVMQGSFESVLSRLEGQFDYVYMDPPYASGFYERAVELLLRKHLLREGGYIIAEHDGTLQLGCIKEVKRRKYGKAYVSWLCEEDR